jgi:hypothetical protein
MTLDHLAFDTPGAGRMSGLEGEMTLVNQRPHVTLGSDFKGAH